MNKVVKAKSYTLRTETGQWLGQVVLTEDGVLTGVTDYGNLGYAWRSFGDEDFRKFILSIDIGYFATKIYNGLAYIAHGKKFEKSCNLFAEKILPALKIELQKEIDAGINW